MVQWLRLCASNTGGTGSIPGQGTKIPHATPWSQKNTGGFSHASFSGSQFLYKMREINKNFLPAPKHQKRKQGWSGLLPGQMATSVKCCQTPANAGLSRTRKGWPFPSCGPLPRGPLSARPMPTGRTVPQAASPGADGKFSHLSALSSSKERGTGSTQQTQLVLRCRADLVHAGCVWWGGGPECSSRK